MPRRGLSTDDLLVDEMGSTVVPTDVVGGISVVVAGDDVTTDAVELVNGKDDDTTDEDAAAAAALAKAPGRGLLSVCPANEIQR